MRKKNLWMVGMLAVALTGALAPAWAQDNTPAPTGDATQPQQPQEPVPAYGQENAPPPVAENPPLSGLDLPNLEPNSAPISYIKAGATFSESADTNVTNSLGGGQYASITRGLGSLTLQRLWSHYDLAADYIGGVGYYDVHGEGLKSLQQGDIDQKITWKRGQLSLRDSFSYLPEGNFGGGYGSTGSEGISSLGTTAFGQFWGGGGLGTLGLASRIINVALADVEESLTPKSSFTAAGGYAITHFYGNDVQTGGPFIGTSQMSAQVGYDRLISAHTQLALVYGYQDFNFSIQGTAFHSHVFEGMYGHRISGRMDFLAAFGPQLTFIDEQSAVCSNPMIPIFFCTLGGGQIIPTVIKDTKIGVAGQARLRYRFPKTSLELSYQRYETSGAGLFAGAESDVARLTAGRPISRVWGIFFDLGFSRNGRIQPLSEEQVKACQATSSGGTQTPPPCPSNDAAVYTYGFLGGGVHRPFGRSWHMFASYQFNELAYDHSFCVQGATCNRISNRGVFTLGLDWTPRPLRID
jgi:hypothetical protein